MKSLLLVFLCLLCGCSTLSSVRKTFVSDPEVPATEKRAYLENLDLMKETTKQFRVYHLLAVGMIVAGVAMIVLRRGNTACGVATTMSGFIVSGWAMFAPGNQWFIGWFLGAMIAAGIAYFVLKIGRSFGLFT